MNNISLIGNVGNDLALAYTPRGTAVLDISLASHDRSSGEEKTHWIDCTAFGKVAEILGEHVSKGDKLGITGRLEERRWTNQEGQARRCHRVIVTGFDLIQPKRPAHDREPEPDHQDQPETETAYASAQ